MKKYSILIALLFVFAFGLAAYASHASESTGVINLNTATLKDLHMLDAMDTKLALNIIAYRNANGPFKSVNDLIKVKGMTRTKLNEIKPYLVLEGQTTYDISKFTAQDPDKQKSN